MAKRLMLFPADRVPPARGTPNIAAAIAHARNTVRDYVPNGGVPRTYDELIKLVRDVNDDGYLLTTEQIIEAIDEVKAQRPVDSQKEYIDDPFELVAEKPKKVKE